MRRWVIIAFLLSLPMLAYSQSGPQSSSLKGVVDAVTADTTAKDTSNCLNLYKPYRIVIPPGSDSLVVRETLEDFADFLDIQVDEIYARVRDAVCDKLANDITTPCTLSVMHIEQCEYDTAGLLIDGAYNISPDRITMNTYALEIRYKTDAFTPPDDTVFSWNPVLRLMNRFGDSLEFQAPDGIEVNVNRLRYIMPQTKRGNKNTNYRIWAWDGDQSDGEADNTAGEGYQYSGALFPLTGLTQSGRQSVNTSMDRDTIVFATKKSDTTGGGYDAGLTITSKSSSGFRYDQGLNGTVDDYVAIVQWGPHDGSYAGDSLWVVSKTDSSFIIGIKYSTSARVMTYITHGYLDVTE